MGKVGKVRIQLSKPYYLAGEVVNGVVYADLKDEIEVDKIYVKGKRVHCGANDVFMLIDKVLCGGYQPKAKRRSYGRKR